MYDSIMFTTMDVEAETVRPVGEALRCNVLCTDYSPRTTTSKQALVTFVAVNVSNAL